MKQEECCANCQYWIRANSTDHFCQLLALYTYTEPQEWCIDYLPKQEEK